LDFDLGGARIIIPGKINAYTREEGHGALEKSHKEGKGPIKIL